MTLNQTTSRFRNTGSHYIAGNGGPGDKDKKGDGEKKEGDGDPKSKKKSRAASIMATGLVAAAVTSQLDSPVPGPADVVAVGEIVVFGIIATGVLVWDAVFNSEETDIESSARIRS